MLEKLRTGEPLTAKDKVIHEHGLVSVLRELHDDLDRAVFDAYGWNDLGAELVGRPGATTPLPDKPAAQAAAEEELLSRLVKLNAECAAEEARGLVHWLRPEFQRGTAAEHVPDQPGIELGETAAARPAGKVAWPKDGTAQAKAIADLLAASPAALSRDDIAASVHRPRPLARAARSAARDAGRARQGARRGWRRAAVPARQLIDASEGGCIVPLLINAWHRCVTRPSVAVVSAQLRAVQPRHRC